MSTTKFEDMRLTPRIVEGENWLPQVVLWSLHIYNAQKIKGKLFKTLIWIETKIEYTKTLKSTARTVHR